MTQEAKALPTRYEMLAMAERLEAAWTPDDPQFTDEAVLTDAAAMFRALAAPSPSREAELREALEEIKSLISGDPTSKNFTTGINKAWHIADNALAGSAPVQPSAQPKEGRNV